MQQTTCPMAPLFDHLVGAGEQHRWYFEPERLRGLAIEHQPIVGGLLIEQADRRGSVSQPDLTLPGSTVRLRQFAFTPVALTKAAFMLSSFLTCASSSAGVRTSGSTPIVVSLSCTLGTCMAFNVSR